MDSNRFFRVEEVSSEIQTFEKKDTHYTNTNRFFRYPQNLKRRRYYLIYIFNI